MGRARPWTGPAPAALLCVLALLVFDALAPGTTSAATEGQWSWPLDGQPLVVRAFELPTQPWLAGHRGVDLRASPGEPVRAAGDGRVTFAGWVGGVPAVAVAHPDGLHTTYQPVLAAVTRGDDVERGAILGRVSAGGSHCSPLACLHWGLRQGTTYLDPLSLVGVDLQVRLLPFWSESTLPARLGAAAQSSGRAPPAPTPPPIRPPITSRAAETGSSDSSSTSGWAVARLGALNRARAFPWEEW